MDYSLALKRMFEAPWSPPPEFLPVKRSPEDFGNSALPYRDLISPVSDRLRAAQESEQQISISRWSNVYTFSVPIENLHPGLEGKTILHLSDVHFLKDDPRPILELQTLARWLRAADCHPDILAFTGDAITKLPDDLCDTALRCLNDLASECRHSLFVQGNHDYHGRVPEYISKRIESAGFCDITNSNFEFCWGGGRLNFYGIDDAYFGSPRAPERMSSDETNIALVHNLDAIRSNFPAETDLILSGHTHWGELNLSMGSTLPILDGMWWMGKWGYSDNINQHTRHWAVLTERTLSFVHPGLARYYVPRMLAHPPGFVLHTLQSADTERSNFMPPHSRFHDDLLLQGAA